MTKKSAAEIREDLKAHVDFLAEAGAGFVLRRPGEEPRRGTYRPPAGTAARASSRPAAPAAPSARRGTGLQPAPAAAAAPAPSPASLAGRPPQTDAERAALEEIERQVRACTRCALHRFRTKAVPGEGNPSAELMFIGEGPGRDEDLQGRPFVGRAGQLLRRIIAAMTFREDEVYIANMVKCRPPENRVPHGDEIEACSPYLVRQIELIRPKAIVTLGKTPTDFFAPGREGMTARRGRFGEYRGIPVMPTFHPSYLVRNENNRELRRMVWEDMQKVMALLGRK
ncbi:MAG: uracil-DNA glycosylase [Acidobacteriota bacterium]